MTAKSVAPHQMRRPVLGPSIPPSPPESPPSRASHHTGAISRDHNGIQKSKNPLNLYQRNLASPGIGSTHQRRKMPNTWQYHSAWRLENPNSEQNIQHQIHHDVHTAFAMQQQREAQKWIDSAKRLSSTLDLANSPMTVLPRLQPQNPNAPRIRAPLTASKPIICPSGYRYLESTGYLRSVPIFRPTPNIRHAVPDRSWDRDVDYIRAYHISRGTQEIRQAAVEQAALDVNMLEWREGIRSLPGDERRSERHFSDPMELDSHGRMLTDPVFGEEAITEGEQASQSS
ncbi:MAG: hypothetical protein M1820_003005 [Bogoriella megaspora]|nr:MAG: hypothetical protein M1820_003005 [Bogoriella megaspora]